MIFYQKLSHNLPLRAWIWKWHVIAGLITLPFMFLLAITGSIYLFKEDVNQQLYKQTLTVNPGFESQPISLSEQLIAVQQSTVKNIASVTLSQHHSQATEFTLMGKGRAGTRAYVDPYTGEVTGNINQQETLMYKVRKLHGELLLGKTGTLMVELVASWFIVLLITGLYIWWPPKGAGLGGFFTVRTNRGRRILWRDIHAVVGFWLSAFMLVILAGGMPWTDVFGSQLKWVQKQTDTGYPTHWRSGKGLESQLPMGTDATPLNLETIATKTADLGLAGKITISLPQSELDTYRIANRAFFLEQQQVVYLDQYSGAVVKSLTWDDVGVLMDLRQVFMRLHQGEYGTVNWFILLMVAALFSLTTVAGLISYLKRKPAGGWGIPKVPGSFQVDLLLLFGVIALGLVFPLFGASVVLLTLFSFLKSGRLFRRQLAEQAKG